MTLPSTCKALVTREGKLSRESIPLPQPGDHQVLVRVLYVAQNPTDVQSLDKNAFGDDAVLGCDFLGVVELIGSKVSRVNVNQHVAGLVWGGEIKGLGAYAEYTLADEKICFPLPAGISPEQGATVPLAACTALLALFSQGSLAIKKGSKETVLIWGGSSSVGQFAIQIGKYYGLTVVTTCSPRHRDQAIALGAAHVFDYRDDEVVSKIKEATNGDLKFVFDTIGNETSSSVASQAISETGGTLCTVRPGKAFTEGVNKQTKVTDVLVWTAFLKEHRYGDFHWPINEADHALAADFFSQLPGLLSGEIIKPNAAKLLTGLDSVLQGFQDYRDGRISNFKVVYKL